MPTSLTDEMDALRRAVEPIVDAIVRASPVGFPASRCVIDAAECAAMLAVARTRLDEHLAWHCGHGKCEVAEDVLEPLVAQLKGEQR